jgi:hypothetical protein
MELIMKIVAELRRIADDLDKQLQAAANAQIEHRLIEIKRQFIESFKRSPGLRHLDAEEAWEKIKDSVRNDLQKKPGEWST